MPSIKTNFVHLLAAALISCLLEPLAMAQEDLISRPGKRDLRDAEKAPAPPPLTVMSYNIKNIFSPPPNDWPTRLPKVAQIIEKHAPAIVGMQEALYPQIKDLLTALPAYDWIGLGRLGDSRDEFMAVFYEKARLEPLEFGHFWLSDTPRLMGSATWGHDNRRMVTWVLFREKAEGRIFYLLNTHFDHQAVEARAKSAELIRDAIAPLLEGVPLILMGDFNAAAEDSDPYVTLTEGAGLKDSWLTAETRTGEGLNTFNSFRFDTHDGGRRIDWILYRGPIAARVAVIDNHSENELYPSDHFPVTATLEYE
jgi:endonuclease/exonuclease/phosphatase family metal-dependent hydrolase